MARSLPVENLLPQNAVSIINYLQQYTELAQWETPCCRRPQPATDNDVRDGRSNWLVAPPPSWAVPPELHLLLGVDAAYKSQDLLHKPGLDYASTGMPDQRTACGIRLCLCVPMVNLIPKAIIILDDPSYWTLLDIFILSIYSDFYNL